MQNNLNQIISNALIINKDNLFNNCKKIINDIENTILNNKKLIIDANNIDIKNSNGFNLDFDVLLNIFSNVKEEKLIYGDVLVSERDNEKKLIYGKEILDYGNVLIISDGNPYITLEMALKNILAGNTMIFSNSGVMYGTNKCLIELIGNVLEKYNISKNLIQIYVSKDFNDILKNYANIDLVICIGDRLLQNSILEKSKIKTIISGYENFDLYIEDETNLNFINKIINLGLNIQLYINNNINFESDDAIIVNDIDEAIAQINYNGNKYSSSIFTKSKENASKFIKEVKSKIVCVNTSPTIERIIDIDQKDLVNIKTIIYPQEFKIKNNN